MEVALQEELKGIYSKPKPFHLETFIRGGLKHPNPLNMLFEGYLMTRGRSNAG